MRTVNVIEIIIVGAVKIGGIKIGKIVIIVAIVVIKIIVVAIMIKIVEIVVIEIVVTFEIVGVVCCAQVIGSGRRGRRRIKKGGSDRRRSKRIIKIVEICGIIGAIRSIQRVENNKVKDGIIKRVKEKSVNVMRMQNKAVTTKIKLRHEKNGLRIVTKTSSGVLQAIHRNEFMPRLIKNILSVITKKFTKTLSGRNNDRRFFC